MIQFYRYTRNSTACGLPILLSAGKAKIWLAVCTESSLGAAFFGESMFHRTTDASKVALVHLVARLIHGGYQLLDAQFHTDHLGQFGAVEIRQEDYLALLAKPWSVRRTFIRCRRTPPAKPPCRKSPRRRKPDVLARAALD